jgi:two-component system OmpR family sensor kinase/two-component system sensor histidine kinase BaeS
MKRHHFPHRPPFRKDSRLFKPFAFLFGGITFLFILAIGVVVYMALMHGKGDFRGGILIPLCGVPLFFIVTSFILGGLAFRRFGKPMSEIFDAIDSVSEGDLTVRVPERHARQFGLLAKRFNHMVSELERADQQRRNLTADIAHELRTPLHIIQGNLEGVIDGVYQPTPEHINNTLDETKLLARLVNDLQTLSLAEAGQLPLHPTRFLLADLMNDLTSSFSSSISASGIDLKTDISDPSQEITADYDRLNQVLSNLISNAIRHTPGGGTISLATGPTPGGVRIEVRDNGAGIPAQDVPFIFDRFWRGDKSRTGRAHSGLGLAIAKQLIHAHRGTITAESEVGKGTIFLIEIPIAIE